MSEVNTDHGQHPISAAEQHLYVVIPAAGHGQRFSSTLPKQHCQLSDRSVLQHSLDCFIQRSDITAVVLVLSADDEHVQQLDLRHATVPVLQVEGGAERDQSVLKGLSAAYQHAHASDPEMVSTWVMVHDAARPLLTQADLQSLIDHCLAEQCAGLLAQPCSDTIKLVSKQPSVEETLPRQHLWRAQTPQMAPLNVLISAMQTAAANKLQISDEASALEAAGHEVQIIPSQHPNFKITYADDLIMADAIMQARHRQKRQQGS